MDGVSTDTYADSKYAGDEPFMLARNLDGVAVLVDRNRVKSGRFAIDHLGADLLLLDDGMQYLDLAHGLDVVLVDSSAPFGTGAMLPRGTLREPPRNLERAGYILLTKCDGSSNEKLIAEIRRWNRTAEIIECAHGPIHLENVFTRERQPLEFLQDKWVGAISAIAVPEALHVHFNGAGGNIGAGKYNDGSPANRRILGERLADGMRRAWEMTRREPVTTNDLRWRFEPVALPVSRHLDEDRLVAQLKGREASFLTANGAGRLAWLRRAKAGHQIDIGCLALGRARILHMPGELFVEYQLAAKAERKDLFVAMAAYGDYGPYYIGTSVAYTEGGYETEPRSSNVAPEVESVLMGAIRKLLRD